MPSLYFVGGTGFLLNTLNKEDITLSISVIGDSVWCLASWKKGRFSVSKRIAIADLLTTPTDTHGVITLCYRRLIELTLKELEETVGSLELSCEKSLSPPAD